MAGHDTMRRNGGWSVELITPIKHGLKEISVIDIQPPNFNHVIRWGEHLIPSCLALLAELSGVPEVALKMLVYPDVERVMIAFASIVPPSVRRDIEAGSRPLASSVDELPQNESVASDQSDPRFPHIDGPVVRIDPTLDPANRKPPPPVSDPGMGIEPEGAIMRAVR